MGDKWTGLNNIQDRRSLFLLERSKVNWSTTVWSQYGIPRHNFLLWLVVLDRCPTWDRLISWGLTVPPLCLLCNSAPESRDHLFHVCNYSFDLWSLAAGKLCITPLRTWDSRPDALSSSSEGPTTAKTPHPSSLSVSDLLDLEREKHHASH